jgi:hypothetical protein
MSERKLDRGFAEAKRRQIRLGLKLTPAERLRWLEDALRTFSRWKGKARTAARKESKPDGG